MTKIEWTDLTLNPTTGCDRVSPGCDNCYALTMARRLKAMGSAKYQNDGDPRTSGPGFGITEHPDVLTEPFSWRTPRKVFVNSMSDLFHSGVSDDFIAQVWAVMAMTPQHTYQVLTKRHGRLRSLLNDDAFHGYVAGIAVRLSHEHDRLPGFAGRTALPNVWLGVSVEDQKRADLRIPALLDTPAAVRFLSCEPLLGPVDLTCGNVRPGFHGPCDGLCDGALLSGIDWVIVGGESGQGARPMHPDRVRQLRDQTQAAGAALHFKQWGSWAPAWDRPLPGDLWVYPDGRTCPWEPGDGHTRSGLAEFRGEQGSALMRRAAKDITGRELDGRTWDEFPAVAA